MLRERDFNGKEEEEGFYERVLERGQVVRMQLEEEREELNK